MSDPNPHHSIFVRLGRRSWPWMLLGITLVIAAYLPGVSGGWIFDDYPNIVDNKGVQPQDASISSLTAAALSSPSSEFKRPLASLTFAVNYLATGIAPGPMKITNIAIHVLNGCMVFFLARLLMAGRSREPNSQDNLHAALVSVLWMALPINLTAVLYVVQRMESLANLFVLAGLLGYAAGRRRMVAGQPGFVLAAGALVAATAAGLMAKETAVLTPLYALLVEILIFKWRDYERAYTYSRRTVALFLVVLAVPLLVGSAVVVPRLLADSAWASRSFTLHERLLSECRIVALYLRWTILPTPSDLSFYHDDFVVSKGWLAPPTTLASAGLLASLAIFGAGARRRWPLVSLGIAWFFSCHLLTGTIVPLELIYEHRNYFSSLGIVLSLVAALRGCADPEHHPAAGLRPRDLLLLVLGSAWLLLTAFTAYRWGGDPLRLPQELAFRAPTSPRAQYELGRTYVILTRYKPDSPFLNPAYQALERAAAIPKSSTLPEQALIFLNARMHLPIKDAWWESMREKLERGPVSIEDESAIMALASCKLDGLCELQVERMLELYVAALSHPKPRARLIGSYSDFAWTALHDERLGYAMAKEASDLEPAEPAYHITVVKQAIALADFGTAETHMAALEQLNIGGRLGSSLKVLRSQVARARAGSTGKQADSEQ